MDIFRNRLILYLRIKLEIWNTWHCNLLSKYFALNLADCERIWNGKRNCALYSTHWPKISHCSSGKWIISRVSTFISLNRCMSIILLAIFASNLPNHPWIGFSFLMKELWTIHSIFWSFAFHQRWLFLAL